MKTSLTLGISPAPRSCPTRRLVTEPDVADIRLSDFVMSRYAKLKMYLFRNFVFTASAAGGRYGQALTDCPNF